MLMRATRVSRMLTVGLGLATLALAPTTAAANVQVGSSGWQWGNPLPQGNTLRAISFAGGVGYSAGDFGTLLRTGDAGTTWTGLLSGTFTGLSEVQAIDTNSVFAGGGCVARRSDDFGASFRRVAFTPVESSCREPLAAAWFVSETIGYLVLADGTVLRTDNNGDTFAQRTPLPGTRVPGGRAAPTDILFMSESSGVGATSDGKYFRTTDGANSWTLVGDIQRAIQAFTFLDATIGFAVGDGGLFLRTTDGGASWTPKDLGVGANLRTVRCASAKLCVITTEKGDQLVRTDDGGDTPAKLVTPSPDAIHAAAFASPTQIVAGGAIGSTAVSDDAGLTFRPIGGRLTGIYNRVRAGGRPGAAFAPGDNGSLARTVDGGKTWTRGNVATSEDVFDVSFPSNEIGFALDVAGGLFRTDDGGATWRTLDTGTTARPSAVLASSANVAVLVGPTGIRRSSDGGATFTAVSGRAVARARLQAVDTAGSTLVAYGTQELIRSSDGGRSWSAITKPGKARRVGRKLVNRTAIRLVDFVDARRGFLSTVDGRLYRTANGGRRWTQIRSTGTERAYGMAFSSAKRGYLVIDRFGDGRERAGYLLRTTDAGATWHPQFVVASPIVGGGIAATGAGIDYLLGGESSLLSSTTGGEAGKASTLTATTPRRRYTRPVKTVVTGRLAPAQGNELVTVSYLPPGSTRWQHQTVRTAATGAFTTSWRLRRGATTFVAQWSGDFRSTGDGSPVLTVQVAKR